MGVLSDKLTTLIEKMKESDEKMMDITTSIMDESNKLIESIDAIDCSIETQIKDAIQLLETHGYVVTAK